MEIVQIASEITPIAKVGGLGDVIMGLSRELVRQGHKVLAVLPFYGCIDTGLLVPEGRAERFRTFFDGQMKAAEAVFFRLNEEIPLALLDSEDGYFRSRKHIYGGADEISSFLIFCRSVADWLGSRSAFPDVLQVHDWPTALVPSLCRAILGRGKKFRSLLTVHNLEYQGRCDFGELSGIGFSAENFYAREPFQDLYHPCMNLLKGGVLTADSVVTVSPTYAREVLTLEGGRGLDGILRNLGDRFLGILNGVDYSYWDPSSDAFLFEKYGAAGGIGTIFEAKRRNKEQVFARYGIPVLPGAPLLACVTRLVEQKGIGMLRDVFAQAESLGVQCLVLGSVPESWAQQAFKELNQSLRATGRGAVFLKNEEGLAHQIFAAADLYAVPSLFEPCGLTQLLALRYGAVPIVRKTGGLADTIVDVTASTEHGNGFVFAEPSTACFVAKLREAIAYYRDSSRWTALAFRGMTQDFSWRKAAQLYLAEYARQRG